MSCDTAITVPIVRLLAVSTSARMEHTITKLDEALR